MLFWRARRRCRWSRTPCSATGGGGVICFVSSAPLLSRAEKKVAAAPITLTFPPVKQRQMKDSLRLRNQDYLHVLYASQTAL